MTTSPEEMRQIATEFYRELLSADPLSEEILQSRDKVWSRIQPRVTEVMREALKAPLTPFELHEAITMLPPHSCPGEDGLTPAFFLQYWDIMQEPLCSAFQMILEKGIMPPQLGAGLIFLIPKGEGPSDDIRKWRPITILSTAYKILAKALSLRLQPMLPQLIHVSQTGFIKERSILDNIFTFWEASAIATKTK
mgnify:FL=1